MAQTIQFGDPGELATRELARRFAQSRPEAARYLSTFEALDRQYGSHGKLPVEDAEELAAVFGLMQGVIAHVSPVLSADLERSNPERPWRILHANFAITAIRTEDPQMMAYAFDALDAALPVEREGFYAEALALAMNPRIPEEVRGSIAARHRRWLRDS